MRKALKTVLCVALVLALAVVIALRVLPPMNAPAQSAAATPTPAAAAAVVPTPTPEPDNGLPKVNTGSWELTLVNAQNSIGEAVPEDLAELESGRYFDARAVDALKDFIAGARAEGLSVCLSSAYRSYNEQTYLFNRKVSQCGGDEAAAARIVNRPGTSEHQLGLCADNHGQVLRGQDEGARKDRALPVDVRPLPGLRLHPALPRRQAGHHRCHV